MLQKCNYFELHRRWRAFANRIKKFSEGNFGQDRRRPLPRQLHLSRCRGLPLSRKGTGGLRRPSHLPSLSGREKRRGFLSVIVVARASEITNFLWPWQHLFSFRKVAPRCHRNGEKVKGLVLV